MITKAQADHIFDLAKDMALASCDTALEDFTEGPESNGYQLAVTRLRILKAKLRQALNELMEPS